MATILLAWELGLNSGHAVRLAHLARAFHGEGHTVSFAVQRPDALRRWRDEDGFIPASPNIRPNIRQAPIWPGLLRHNDVPPVRGERAWGDLLAGMGMHDSGVLEYLLRAWDAVLTDVRPDVVVADFAPAAMLTAKGRVPVVAVGTGFTVPPADGDAFPLLRGDTPVVAEAALLKVVNRALGRVGRAPLSTLTDMARAELSCAATFAELDPYRGHRTGALHPPFMADAAPAMGANVRNGGIFAYIAVADPRTAMLMRALPIVARSGLRVRAYCPGLHAADARDLAAAGVEILSTPESQADIAAHSRLLVTTGGLGMASFALTAGLPMAILPVDLEKALTADAIAKLGSGAVLTAPDSAGLAEQIIAAAHCVPFQEKAHGQAADFGRRAFPPAEGIARQCLILL